MLTITCTCITDSPALPVDFTMNENCLVLCIADEITYLIVMLCFVVFTDHKTGTRYAIL